MSQPNKKNSSEDLMASLMAELKLVPQDDSLNLSDSDNSSNDIDELNNIENTDFGLLDLNFDNANSKKEDPFEIKLVSDDHQNESLVDPVSHAISHPVSHPSEVNSAEHAYIQSVKPEEEHVQQNHSHDLTVETESDMNSEKTVALSTAQLTSAGYISGDRTVAVAGYSNRSNQNNDENIKISVGQSGSGYNSGSGYGGWGSTDSHLAQAENLKMAQDKILELEKENGKLRHQNEELVSASEIIKERSDLLTSQVYEYKNDRESLENSFKNEMALIKSQLNRKDAELQKAQMKIDELDSRLKFDMKKIRIRERELENRLELIRAEKNALVRSKDEQILESRRKIDQLQLEVDSFRQKCVELNRVLETNQDSFKRTTRALRLAMANLELQEENKFPLKKAD